jgi:3-deoxy-D-manno-octulosonic-acid transferase
VTGNLKFDVPPDAALVHAGRAWRERLGRPVLLLASTREGEEKLLLDALPAWDGRLLVVVVPRHPQRFEEVSRWAQARRTQVEMPGAEVRGFLGDTMGQMAFYYAACDAAVIGGSFQPLGGQNLIEALSAGAPVVAGPHMFNFAEATRLATQAGAALQVADAAEGARAALEIIGAPSRREAMAQAGRALVELHRGATERHLEACLRLLSA